MYVLAPVIDAKEAIYHTLKNSLVYTFFFKKIVLDSGSGFVSYKVDQHLY